MRLRFYGEGVYAEAETAEEVSALIVFAQKFSSLTAGDVPAREVGEGSNPFLSVKKSTRSGRIPGVKFRTKHCARCGAGYKYAKFHIRRCPNGLIPIRKVEASDEMSETGGEM